MMAFAPTKPSHISHAFAARKLERTITLQAVTLAHTPAKWCGAKIIDG
jgi:hypothetical protein